jgi:hypothetical protein
MDMLKKMVFITLILLLSIPFINALTWETECNDTQKLRYYMTFSTCENNNCTSYNITQYRNCTFGCDSVTNICSPSPSNVNFTFLIIFGSFSIILIVIVIFKKKR